MSGIVPIVIGVAVIVLIIGRRIAGQRVTARRQVVLPLVLIVIGVVDMNEVLRHSHLTNADVGFLAASAAVGLVCGVLRGAVAHVYVRDGEPVERYGVFAVVLWFVTLALRLGMDFGASHFGASHDLVNACMLPLFGVSLIGESLVVVARLRSMGVTTFADSR